MKVEFEHSAVWCHFGTSPHWNLGLLFMLLFFIYAALGVELFGELVCNEDYPCEGMSRHATFENFGMAFLTLFQDTLRECQVGEHTCNPSLQFISPMYFVSFVLTAQFVLINVVVAVLMKHLDDSNKEAQEDAEMDAEIELELAQGGLCCLGALGGGAAGGAAGGGGADKGGGNGGNRHNVGISANVHPSGTTPHRCPHDPRDPRKLYSPAQSLRGVNMADRRGRKSGRKDGERLGKKEGLSACSNLCMSQHAKLCTWHHGSIYPLSSPSNNMPANTRFQRSVKQAWCTDRPPSACLIKCHRRAGIHVSSQRQVCKQTQPALPRTLFPSLGHMHRERLSMKDNSAL
ncbi:hypothetical protein JZ751_028770 [Albula glossodonta]|uniref:Ion transport domain-containing protein n=1 Tax=Albula glossodonta TaxID=121402 RepID=A0A8T2NDH2_9TELE|nr:hypothetical protein JZ751_028770 [Albula glossodonta]